MGKTRRDHYVRLSASTLEMPLTYRDKGTSGTQLDVLSGDEVIAFLWKNVLSVMAHQQADWTFHSGPTKGPRAHGSADTINAAKDQIEKEWQAWLTAAGLQYNAKSGSAS